MIPLSKRRCFSAGDQQTEEKDVKLNSVVDLIDTVSGNMQYYKQKVSMALNSLWPSFEVP